MEIATSDHTRTLTLTHPHTCKPIPHRVLAAISISFSPTRVLCFSILLLTRLPSCVVCGGVSSSWSLSRVVPRVFFCFFSCLHRVLSRSCGWYDPRASQSSFVIDLNGNEIDARGRDALHQVVIEADRRAAQAATRARHTEEEHRKSNGAGRSGASSSPSVLIAPSSGSSVSAAAAAGMTSFFRADVLFGGSSWVCPALRAPPFSPRLTPHITKLMQQSGCAIQTKYVVQILCQHQIRQREDDSQGRDEQEREH
jgi:hypothetical protein